MIDIMTREEASQYWEQELESRKKKCLQIELALREMCLKESLEQMNVVMAAYESASYDQLHLATQSLDVLHSEIEKVIETVRLAPYSHESWDQMVRLAWGSRQEGQ